MLKDIIINVDSPRDNTTSESSKAVLVKMSSFDFALELGNNTEFDFQLLGFQGLKTVEVCFSTAHEQLVTDRPTAIKRVNCAFILS